MEILEKTSNFSFTLLWFFLLLQMASSWIIGFYIYTCLLIFECQAFISFYSCRRNFLVRLQLKSSLMSKQQLRGHWLENLHYAYTKEYIEIPCWRYERTRTGLIFYNLLFFFWKLYAHLDSRQPNNLQIGSNPIYVGDIPWLTSSHFANKLAHKSCSIFRNIMYNHPRHRIEQKVISCYMPDKHHHILLYLGQDDGTNAYDKSNDIKTTCKKRLNIFNIQTPKIATFHWCFVFSPKHHALPNNNFFFNMCFMFVPHSDSSRELSTPKKFHLLLFMHEQNGNVNAWRMKSHSMHLGILPQAIRM